jgi:uncharacterized Zn ribbon protein
MSLPENVDLVRVRGYWFDQDGTGTDRTIRFDPLVSNLIDADSFAYIKTDTVIITPDPDDGYFFVDLIASNDPDLTPSAWTVTLQGQPSFTISVDYNAFVQDVGDGLHMKAVWLVDAAGTGTPPDPIDTYYTSTQTNSAIAEALDGLEITSAVSSVAGRTGDVVLVQGDISGLVAALAAKAADTAVVHNTGAETVAGVKTFSSAPVVPSPGAAGNPVRNDDSRLSDARTPTTHTHAESDVTSLVSDLAGKQPANAALADIAGLSPTNGDTLLRVAGHWLNQTMTQLKTALGLTKADVGLSNVDNVADSSKPVSSAQQTALDGKINLSTFTTKGDTLAASASATPVRVPVGTAGQVYTADPTQTGGVKWADAPATYTDEQARDAIGAALVEGDNITITVNDVANTITIEAPATGTVTSVTAEDASIVMGGTDVDITVAVGEISQDQVVNLTTSLEGKADFSHTHDESDVSNLVTDLAGKADATHTHAESDVTGLTSDLAAKQDSSEKAQANGYASLDGSTKVPVAQLPTGTTSSTVTIGNDSRLSNARTPTAHHTTHNTGGTDAIAPADIGAAAASHTHVESDVTSLTTDLAAKVAKSTFTTKGDMLVATGSATPVRVGVGTDAQVWTADSSQTAGAHWADAPAGYSDEQARDAIGAALVGGDNITVTVDDAANTITIDADTSGSVESVTAEDATIVVDNTDPVNPTVAVGTIAQSQVTSLTSDLSGKQASNANLTDIAGLTATDGDVLRRVSGHWANQTLAAFKTALSLVKGDVGLGNVDNTSDSAKNSATATLTNKTLTSPVINSPTGIVASDVGAQPADSDLTAIAALTPGSGNVLAADGAGWVSKTYAALKTSLSLNNVDNVSMATERAATATLTNKTLTSPVINTPTGIVKGDVGLGSVDNTSDATKNSATATLTNKTLTAPVINSPTGITASDVGAQAASSKLTDIAALTATSGNVITGNGTTWTSAAPAASPWSARVETIADSSSLTGDSASGATQVGVCTALTSDAAVNAPSNGYVGAPYRYVITASGGTRVCTPTGFAASTDNGSGAAISVPSGKTVSIFAQYIGTSGWLYGGYELLA